MALYYCTVLVGIPLLYICRCNAEIALHSFPERTATVNANSSAAVSCWTVYDTGTRITLKLEHEGSPLLLNNNDSLLKPASGTCNQDIVPNGRNCENITVTIPGDVSLNQTTLTCYLVNDSSLARRDETLDVTIVVTRSPTPECNCTCDEGPTTEPTTITPTPSMASNGDTEAGSMIQTGTDFKIPFVVFTVALGFSVVINIILAMALYKVWHEPQKRKDPDNPHSKE